MKETDSRHTGAVTTIIQQIVRDGMDETFEAWSKRIRAACRSYEGYLGTELIRPVGGARRYISIIRFSSYAYLDAWMQSDERLTLLEETKAFCDAPPEVSRYESLEFLFPESTVAGKPPSREKMMVVTYLGLLLPVNFIPPLVKGYVTEPRILATAASLAIITPLMVYAIMPVLTRLFRPWLKG